MSFFDFICFIYTIKIKTNIMYTPIKFEKLLKKYHQELLEGKDYLIINRDEINDSTCLEQGVYYEGKLLYREYIVKSIFSEQTGEYYVENIYEILEKINKNINVKEMKYEVTEIQNLNNLDSNDSLKQDQVILLPEKNLYFLTKKLDNNSCFDIKDFIYTFIYNNGFQLNVLIDLVLQQVNNSNNYKNNSAAVNFLFKTYDVKEIKSLYFEICKNIKYKEDKEELDRYKHQSIGNVDFIINYDILITKPEFQNTTDLKSYLKVLKQYKSNIKKRALMELGDAKILQYINDHNTFSVDDISDILNVSQSKIYQLITKNNITLSVVDRKKQKVKVEYEVMLMNKLKPSYQILSEKTNISLNSVKKYITELELKIYSHKEYSKSLEEHYNRFRNEEVVIEKKVRKPLDDDDFLSFGYKINDDIFNEMNRLVDKRIQYEINKEDVPSKLKEIEDKWSNYNKPEELYKKITKESSLETLKMLQDIDTSIMKKDDWGMVKNDYDDVSDFDDIRSHIKTKKQKK